MMLFDSRMDGHYQLSYFLDHLVEVFGAPVAICSVCFCSVVKVMTLISSPLSVCHQMKLASLGLS